MRRTITLAAVFLLVLTACGDDGAATSTVAPPTSAGGDDVVDIAISVVGDVISVTVEGIPTSGRVHVAIGAEIRLTVTADTDDEVHLHGYDLMADVIAGAPAVLEFSAGIPGIFEVEFEDAAKLLVELQVS